MKKRSTLMTVISGIFFSGLSWGAGSIVAEIKTTGPDFEAKSKAVSGVVKKSGDRYVAEKIQVAGASFETGMELRDEHLRDAIKIKQHPQITIERAVGKDGKGMAVVSFAGVKKQIPFRYTLKKDKIKAKFDLSLKEFGITGISYAGVGVKDNVSIVANLPLE